VGKGHEVVVTMINRWKTMDNVFIILLLLILAFSYMDARQIIPFSLINTSEMWDMYNQYTGPAIVWLWYVVILAIGIIWHIIHKDKSEALALVSAGWALIFFGTQDVFYFIFSEQAMTPQMCWVNMLPIRTVSRLLGESCPSPTSFIISAVLGVFVSYKLYHYFKVAKW
jgi:hypothetical protein